jgi:RNA-directed DNA polymerase
MRRHRNLYQQICSVENLRMADAIAQQGKGKQHGVIRHNSNNEANIQKLHRMLVDKTFRPSKYIISEITKPKKREIFKYPYFPDRIVDHAIMNVIGHILQSTFTADTYACIRGRGVHKAASAIRRALKDETGTKYCLQMDIKKFYPSIDHDILKKQLRRKFKDPDLLWLLDMMIDSAPGLPIGKFLSQSLSTFYLTGFDHWVKEIRKIMRYFRYVDDMIILASDKEYLHQIRRDISAYLETNLNISLKPNWRIFPVTNELGIRTLGYEFFRDYTLLGKDIKKNFARAVKKGKGKLSIDSYKGWAKHCNSKHLIKKLLLNEPI